MNSNTNIQQKDLELCHKDIIEDKFLELLNKKKAHYLQLGGFVSKGKDEFGNVILKRVYSSEQIHLLHQLDQMINQRTNEILNYYNLDLIEYQPQQY